MCHWLQLTQWHSYQHLEQCENDMGVNESTFPTISPVIYNRTSPPPEARKKKQQHNNKTTCVVINAILKDNLFFSLLSSVFHSLVVAVSSNQNAVWLLTKKSGSFSSAFGRMKVDTGSWWVSVHVGRLGCFFFQKFSKLSFMHIRVRSWFKNVKCE